MKKEKVLIVHNYYKISGGEDSVVENEKEMLELNGHSVIIYSRNNNELKKMNFLKKISVTLNSIFSFRTKKDIKKIVKEKNIDIVHVHNTLPLISPSVYWGAKSGGAKVVQTIHNFRLICPSATLTNKNRICEKCIEKNLISAIKGKCYRNSYIQTIVSVCILKFNRIIGTYNKVDRYIALTDFNKKKLECYLDSEKIAIKPNFVSNQFNELGNKENKEKQYFIYVGRIDKLKGIEVLLRAWKDIKNEKLILIGDGPELNNSINFIKENNIDNVEFLGRKDKNEIKKYLKSAKMIVVPSLWYEGFPMTIIEAFSQGVPVIASNIGNLKNIINDNVNGLLFNLNDYKDLAIKINKLHKSPDLLKKYSINAYNDFINKYNSKVNYKELKNIYEEIMES
ncbi:glycosyltransferase family 4 protein [Clostridium perfringens]